MSNETPIDTDIDTSDTATDVSKPADASVSTPAEKPQRTGPHPLSWINLVLMLGLFAVAAYAGYLGWTQQQTAQADIAVLRDRLEQAQGVAAELIKREQQMIAQAQRLTESADSLQQQVAHNTDRLGKLPGAERQDWLLAEAEYLLRLANQRLQLERDWSGAVSMLTAADNVLLETRNPRMNVVRADIARELLALRAVPAIDNVGAITRLQALQQQVTSLPWMPEKLIEEPTGEQPVEVLEQQAWYWQLWHHISTSVSNMVRIRTRNEPIAAPLTPDQQYYLQQNMHLMLEQAQVALLREQADLYQHSLKRISDWLDEYLMIDDERTRAARAALTELQGWDVNPQVPDISSSLLSLQKLVEQQRRGTVVSDATQEPAA
ncbi:uroporphyrinogen-III C-methyltransferase [Bacterioplanoides sp. SCSIO 12839]|uniref:uroporphyrinogen-III C-methyltransferase n=1 Tax=Bacterioplanoides sp. SCSIO 12839 TaxID=2829569 RepID=UPI0021067DEC|nr:uroporphyrinogen-III C-methyltransferase [Bacterioplanoides sp. SCSIO 12839]UTW48243.1 uroporphyrinogen-III C-methyltransferase [Bacterioplanoides sp. SCSIO 12839]